ncbi:hypothetical protein B0A55_11404 [Friedmanniomyces simplex]|uniref:C2 domain-containing protein n=1 Tax=Friedmanniomyces simplex TaxID=329884 RepID=A0A4U0WHY9_9PEZI|nr:hypothetical protein B0A55_11404 [Friedmanniomyces simplex]
MSSEVLHAPDGITNEKTSRDGPHTNGDSWAHEAERQAGKEEDENEQQPEDQNEESKHDGPAGGYDATALPSRPPGYTLKITIHRATNLPMADINSFSSDPYVVAQIDSDAPTRHKEDPPIRFRTPTIRQNLEPVWNEEWVLANVPASGFKLKLRVFDEDPADKDDRLGNVHIHVDRIRPDWPGLKEQSYEMKARMASKRAYLIRMAAVCLRTTKHIRGNLFVSIENLGRTRHDGQNGRVYTVGPCRWIRHYDPILGRMMGMKEPDEDGDEPKQPDENNKQQQKSHRQPTGSKDKRKVQKYNFQANQMQLAGPVPAELYHRYVEFKPFVKGMFTSSGVRGFILSKALHHQHSRVYNFDGQTMWGHYIPGAQGGKDTMEPTRRFLDLVHYDKGGRIFTYVLTLDALWRFTETGKEFGIDMLSKHTMHSDVSIYIAFSGEFFVRRLKHPRKPPPPDPSRGNDFDEEADKEDEEADPTTDPTHYELLIDNDSGTYRPNAHLLPLLQKYLSRSLPGLHIRTLDCQADEEEMGRLKGQQRERKKAGGKGIVYTQGDRGSSISSSEEEDLDRVEADYGAGGAGAGLGAGGHGPGNGRGGHGDRGDGHGGESGFVSQAARDQKLRQKARWRKTKGQYRGRSRGGVAGAGEGAGDGEARAVEEDAEEVEAGVAEEEGAGAREAPTVNGSAAAGGESTNATTTATATATSSLGVARESAGVSAS